MGRSTVSNVESCPLTMKVWIEQKGNSWWNIGSNEGFKDRIFLLIYMMKFENASHEPQGIIIIRIP